MLVSEYEMPKTNFTVKYDGESLANHEMDVALLAPALMGIQKVIDALVIESTSGEYKASLKMKGNAKAGSIEIELITQAISSLQATKDLVFGFFGTSDLTASSNIIAHIGALLYLIKKFGRKKPDKVEDIGDGYSRLYFDSETTIINNHVYKVYNNFEVREAVYKAIKPLEAEGINSFSISDDSKKVFEVDKEYASRFIPPNATELMLVNEEESFLQIVKISFNMNNKWQFTKGDETINANIVDKEFIKKVQNRESSFYDGDILHVILQKEQYQEKGKLKTNYSVLKVLNHEKAKVQQDLEF